MAVPRRCDGDSPGEVGRSLGPALARGGAEATLSRPSSVSSFSAARGGRGTPLDPIAGGLRASALLTTAGRILGAWS